MSENVLLWILGALAALEVNNMIVLYTIKGRFDEHVKGHTHIIEEIES